MNTGTGARLGPYVLGPAIGAGGMGEVYRAHDPRLGRDVAIKILPSEVSDDPDRLRRFQQEARAAASLNHPNILTVFDVGSDGGVAYLVTELLDGTTLREAKVDLDLALNYVTQAAEGLSAAHALGIVHRDIKPENLFLTGDGRVKILDFGLAKVVTPSGADGAEGDDATATATGVIVGTVGYMAPEQIRGQAIDARTDIFALGCVLYELVAGRPPFIGETSFDTLSAILKDSPPPLVVSRTQQAVPSGASRIVQRCLQKAPASRFQTASDLAFALSAVSSSTRAPDSLPVAPNKPDKGRAWVAWAIAGAATVGLVAGVFASGFWGRSVSHPTFVPLTFERGTITGARFGPGGRTVYYSAAFGADPSRVFVTHLEGIEPRRLDVPPGFLLGVSSKDELLMLLTNERSMVAPGIMARVPAVGGTPRPEVEEALSGDWAGDGERLAVRRPGRQCEFPIGQKVEMECTSIRISPVAELVAIRSERRLEIRTPAGVVVASDDMPMVFGLAWSPDGREVWFTGSEGGNPHDRALYALSVQGDRRLIARMPGAISVYDVGPDGKSALITTGAGWHSVNHVTLSDARERPLDLRGRTDLMGLSKDGTAVLLNENREVGTGTYLRSTDGSRSVRLTDDIGLGLSPDGAWALVQSRGDSPRLRLISTVTAASRELPLDPDARIISAFSAKWSGDGRRLFVWIRPAADSCCNARLHMWEDSGPWRAVTPSIRVGPFAVSPDGTQVAVNDTGTVTLFPIASADRRSRGEDGRPVVTLDGERGRPIHWSADRRSIILAGPLTVPVRLYRRDLATGRVEPWRTIAPADVTAVEFVNHVFISADERSFAYDYSRAENVLYLARGLR